VHAVVDRVDDLARLPPEALAQQRGQVRADGDVAHAGQLVDRLDARAMRRELGVVAFVALAEVHRHALLRAAGRRPRHRRPERADDHVAVGQVLGAEVRHLAEGALDLHPRRRAGAADHGHLVAAAMEPVRVLEGDLDAAPKLIRHFQQPGDAHALPSSAGGGASSTSCLDRLDAMGELESRPDCLTDRQATLRARVAWGVSGRHDPDRP